MAERIAPRLTAHNERRRKKSGRRAPETIVARETPPVVSAPGLLPPIPPSWKAALTALVAIVGASNVPRGPDTGAQLTALAIVALVAIVAVTRPPR